jgi:hypothetical protein
MKTFVILTCLVLLIPGRLAAQAADGTEERLKALEERIQALEAEVQALKAGQATPAAPAAQTPAAESAPSQPTTVQAPAGTVGTASQALPYYGSRNTAAKVLNPDISMIGDFLATAGHNEIQPVPGLELHEAELGLQSIVDPYARADVFLSFGQEGVELEEGYLTFTSLPGGFVTKVGKMRSSFGVVNTLHNHVLPWTDRPMVTENLVGGEDGLSDVGVSVSRILPAPGDVFLEGTAEVFRGESGDVFASQRNRDVSFVGRLRGYRDLSDSTNLDMGVSYARGHNELGSAFITQLYGMDATLRWKPLRRAIYHSVLARTELFWSDRDLLTNTQRAFGFYTSADYRLNRRWTVGGRYDRSGRAQEADMTDSGYSALLTYWPSEFSQLRTQYRYARYAEGVTGNELRFQLLFSLGAHGAHPF